MTELQPTVHTVDAQVQRVAALLPFPAEFDSDMGGTFALQIDLGRRGGEDDPHDTAGIDPDDSLWWIDIEGGTKPSSPTPDSTPTPRPSLHGSPAPP